MTAEPIQPVVQTVVVDRTPAEAFRHFTDLEAWWPRATHSVGGSRVCAIVVEPRAGGRIFEKHVDGRCFQWGVIRKWAPSESLVFTWHPSREESTAQTVAVQFVADGLSTRVTLTASDWERWGDGAKRARGAYNMGWRWILNRWAGVGGAWMLLVDGMTLTMQGLQRLRGGTSANIARARGELRAP